MLLFNGTEARIIEYWILEYKLNLMEYRAKKNEESRDEKIKALDELFFQCQGYYRPKFK